MATAALAELPQTPASDVKRLGWRGLMRTVGREGKVLVTNHSQPEAVVLSIGEYDALVQAIERAQARDDVALDALRERFDRRLAALAQADAGERLRDVMAQPPSLDGKVRAGASH
ncbi:type II toxin-antitoxin system prevent-host-death family antitoxin [Ramlibacter tataouinensis]|nr:type II toxin-antitoxin system prevent-host-death family antitoxin [Ramlibacter tataouinensis]